MALHSRSLSHLLSAALAGFALLAASTASATLIPRLGGQAYYDDVLDVTWATDASPETAFGALPGRHYYGPHSTWAANLTLGGVGGWRLPSVDRNGDGSISPACSGPTSCHDNEMGFLFSHYGVTVSNPSPLNLHAVGDAYFSNTPTPGPGGVWGFNFIDGSMTGFSTGGNLIWALAVQDGDVLPEPTTGLLMGLGLLGVARVGRKRS